MTKAMTQRNKQGDIIYIIMPHGKSVYRIYTDKMTVGSSNFANFHAASANISTFEQFFTPGKSK